MSEDVLLCGDRDFAVDGNSARRNAKLMGVIKALEASMALMISTIVLFWQQAGMNMAEILWLQAIFAVALALFEVPSGYIADVCGRKCVIVIGLALISIGNLLYAIGLNFLQFIGAEVLLALGFSLVSGADEALIYDSLAAEGIEEDFKRTWGRLISLSFFTAALWAVGGGYLGAYNARLAIALPGLIIGVAAVSALFIREPPRAKPLVEEGHFAEVCRVLKNCFLENKVLAWLLLYAALLLGINQVAVWFYQPYFVFCGVEVIYFGWLFAGMQIISGLSARHSAGLESRIGAAGSCMLPLVLMVLSFLLLGNVVLWWSFIFIVFHQFLRGYVGVVFSDYVNKETAEEVRATTVSIKNSANRVAYIGALLIVSTFAGDGAEVLWVWNALAAMALLAGASALALRPGGVTLRR